MDASADGLTVGHEQNHGLSLCLLWMPQHMDLLLHMDIVNH